MLGKVILLILVAIIGLVAATLWRSGAPLNAPPGIADRLQTYLTSNVAQTSRHSDYPELKERAYRIPPKEMLDRVQTAMLTLKWKVEMVDPRRNLIQAVVSTELLGFEDDFSVTIHPLPTDSSRLDIRSASRVGRADFGANAGHIIAFIDMLEQGIPPNAAIVR